jgi:hypothetical protein
MNIGSKCLAVVCNYLKGGVIKTLKKIIFGFSPLGHI